MKKLLWNCFIAFPPENNFSLSLTAIMTMVNMSGEYWKLILVFQTNSACKYSENAKCCQFSMLNCLLFPNILYIKTANDKCKVKRHRQKLLLCKGISNMMHICHLHSRDSLLKCWWKTKSKQKPPPKKKNPPILTTILQPVFS